MSHIYARLAFGCLPAATLVARSYIALRVQDVAVARLLCKAPIGLVAGAWIGFTGGDEAFARTRRVAGILKAGVPLKCFPQHTRPVAAADIARDNRPNRLRSGRATFVV